MSPSKSTTFNNTNESCRCVACAATENYYWLCCNCMEHTPQLVFSQVF